MRACIFLIVFLMVCLQVKADEKKWAGQVRMNGYSLKDFPDFQKKWRLVTVRFRHDSDELRFIYANDLAYQTLTDGKTDYPEGAVFAKIGFKTVADPLFESSAVPSGAKRYQLMVRDKKKHPESGGWAYAIFDSQGLTLNEDPVQQTQACVACHRIADSRGQVFSLPMNFQVGQFSLFPSFTGSTTQFKFVKLNRSALPRFVKNKIPSRFKQIDSLQGDLQKHLFQGTFNEVRPLLALQAKNEKRPAILISESGTQYSIVLPELNGKECSDAGGKGIWLIGRTRLQADADEIYLRFCQH